MTYKSTSSHGPSEAPGSLFLHPAGEKRPSRARFLVFVRIWAFIHPASPGHPWPSGARSGTPDERKRAKQQGKFPRVWWPRLVGERGRSSSSLHRIPRIVIFLRIVFRAL
jgi:hypothetical protein